MKKLIILAPFLVSIACKNTRITGDAPDPFYSYSIRKTFEGTQAAVVSAHPLASRAGIEVMKKGGNAFDAAIATQLALAVVYPVAGNIGGGGFLVARLASGETISLDYREMAPGAASRNMYLDTLGVAQTSKSQNGHLASGVPGTVAGLFETLKYAKLNFHLLIEPAIELAEKGFILTEKQATSLNSAREDILAYNTTASAFTKERDWRAGDTLVQRDLARTLKRIRDQGQKGFYEGETASLIIEEMKRGGGIISHDDLRNYKAKWREPHRFKYRGYEVIGMGMPSSGGLLVNQMLKMVEPYPIAEYGFHSPAAVQLMVESERRAYADRSEFMGDADFYKVPIGLLTDERYLKLRMNDFDSGRAGSSKITRAGNFTLGESSETTHLSVIDDDGNAVAVTTTLNDGYGSKTVVGRAGFFLNNEMDDFSIKPGVPNMYGAIGGDANAIMPGKRMLSSMTPTIMVRDEKLFMVVGTPGGTTIPTSVFQSIVNVVDFGLDAFQAVNKPKFHHQWLPDVVEIERGFPDSTREQLIKMGYTVRYRGAIGRTEMILMKDNGKFVAVADGRGDDSADGW